MNAGRILAGLAMLTVASTASAQVTQQVNIAVNGISQIAVTGGAQTLTISTAVAGSALTNATASVTWAVTTNQTNQKLSASIDANMPAGLNLQVQAEAPTAGGLSTGPNSLSTSAVDLVSGFSQLAESGLDLTYTLSASLTAAVASMSRTVTYTITAGP
jgi:opacity protein-like surface antigen